MKDIMNLATFFTSPVFALSCTVMIYGFIIATVSHGKAKQAKHFIMTYVLINVMQWLLIFA